MGVVMMRMIGGGLVTGDAGLQFFDTPSAAPRTWGHVNTAVPPPLQDGQITEGCVQQGFNDNIKFWLAHGPLKRKQ